MKMNDYKEKLLISCFYATYHHELEVNSKSVYLKGCNSKCPREKIDAGIEAFASGITFDEVIFYYDSTLFGSGRSGIIITCDRLYWKSEDFEGSARVDDVIDCDYGSSGLFSGTNTEITLKDGGRKSLGQIVSLKDANEVFKNSFLTWVELKDSIKEQEFELIETFSTMVKRNAVCYCKCTIPFVSLTYFDRYLRKFNKDLELRDIIFLMNYNSNLIFALTDKAVLIHAKDADVETDGTVKSGDNEDDYIYAFNEIDKISTAVNAVESEDPFSSLSGKSVIHTERGLDLTLATKNGRVYVFKGLISKYGSYDKDDDPIGDFVKAIECLDKYIDNIKNS